jgi:hypothetical protein
MFEARAAAFAYWIATGLFAIVMTYSGIAHSIHVPWIDKGMHMLGYPSYVSTLLGPLKLLGVVALLVPGYPRLKEWAYAGFGFDILGAAWSHYSSGVSLALPLSVFVPYLVSYVLYRRRSLNTGRLSPGS